MGVLAGAYLKPGGGGGRELLRGLDVARLLGREDEECELDLTVGGLEGLRDWGGECVETQLATLACEL